MLSLSILLLSQNTPSCHPFPPRAKCISVLPLSFFCPPFVMHTLWYLRIYVSPMSSMKEAMARLIREPFGCFEQTSSTIYPLTMAQRYFKSHLDVDPELISFSSPSDLLSSCFPLMHVNIKRSDDILRRGYKTLVGFECKDGGYDWFGSSPASEPLTSFGISIIFFWVFLVFFISLLLIKLVYLIGNRYWSSQRCQKWWLGWIKACWIDVTTGYSVDVMGTTSKASFLLSSPSPLLLSLVLLSKCSIFTVVDHSKSIHVRFTFGRLSHSCPTHVSPNRSFFFFYIYLIYLVYLTYLIYLIFCYILYILYIYFTLYIFWFLRDILYSLTKAGIDKAKIELELNHLKTRLESSEDSYMLALFANICMFFPAPRERREERGGRGRERRERRERWGESMM